MMRINKIPPPPSKKIKKIKNKIKTLKIIIIADKKEKGCLRPAGKDLNMAQI
jgi:hypothetical protein